MARAPNCLGLADRVSDARRRTFDLVADLNDEHLRGPRLACVNPPLWEAGDIAWFQEKWVLRRSGRVSIRRDVDSIYDSTAVAHDSRWDLAQASREETFCGRCQALIFSLLWTAKA